MIQAVIFDLDDTLYDYKALDREAGRRVQDLVCRTLHIDEAEYLEAQNIPEIPPHTSQNG